MYEQIFVHIIAEVLAESIKVLNLFSLPNVIFTMLGGVLGKVFMRNRSVCSITSSLRAHSFDTCCNGNSQAQRRFPLAKSKNIINIGKIKRKSVKSIVWPLPSIILLRFPPPLPSTTISDNIRDKSCVCVYCAGVTFIDIFG